MVQARTTSLVVVKVAVVDFRAVIGRQRERRGYSTRNLLVGLALLVAVAAAIVAVAVDASILPVDAAALAASFAVA